MKKDEKLTQVQNAIAEWEEDPRRMTLRGGVRLDDLRALATTDEEPFPLVRRRVP